MTYLCAVCGESHDCLPDVGYQWPDTYFTVPEDERHARITGNADTCSIDDEYFFIRGILLIPVHDEKEQFGLGVWVSQCRENYETYLANPDTADIGPFFGWLCNSLPFYDVDTWALKTMAHFQGGGQRPEIILEPCDHQLYKEFAGGIPIDVAWRYVHCQNGNKETR